MKINYNNNCPICKNDDIKPILKIKDIPVLCNLLYSSKEEAMSAKMDSISLCYCNYCNHIFNSEFISEKTEYSINYDNTLQYSKIFSNYSKKLASKLIEEYKLEKKTILEIGCGKADFLELICSLGHNKGIGFDKSYDDSRMRKKEKEKKRITIIKDYFSKKYCSLKFDFMICRHVLEHIQYPIEFLGIIKSAFDNNRNASFYFEVPNVMFTLRDLSIWDIIYEHCQYFSRSSLKYLFQKQGFYIKSLKTDYKDQYLCLEGTIKKKNQECYFVERRSNSIIKNYVNRFSDYYQIKIEEWNKKIKKFYESGEKVVVWGAGSKGITFLNTISSKKEIHSIVDLNPYKVNKYIPCTAHKVIDPSKLKKIKPNIVIVMNKIYMKEIEKILTLMGLKCKICSV